MTRKSIYLDQAATSLPKPPAVGEAVLEAMNTMGNAGRGVHEATLTASTKIHETRVKLARLFHAESPERIAFTSNATESLNTALYGCLKPGDHVITTAAEHNSVLRPLFDLEEKGVELTVIPCNLLGRYSYEEMEEAIRDNTRAIVCCHGSNLTGNLFDIERIGDICRTYGLLFILDTAQTAGIFPIDVQQTGIDILCFTGHKTLMGPQGTGGIYVRSGLELTPLKRGGTGVQTYLRHQPVEMPVALEAGTLNGHGIAGLHAALSYLEKTGSAAIREREQELMWRLYHGLSRMEGITIYGDFRPDTDGNLPLRCPIVSFNLEDADSAEVGELLFHEYGISVRTGGHCAPRMHEALHTVSVGAVRASISHFNTEEEIDALILAVKELLEEE